MALISHIIDCLGALRDVNKVYRSKGSLASRSVGTRVMFGFTAELGNVLLDAITFDPPTDLAESSLYYSQVAGQILSVFPEIAAQATPSTGKVLIHHTCLKTSAIMSQDAIKMVLKAFPAGAWTTDRTGALPLHWITHNAHCSQEMVAFLITANPKGPWVADVDGYTPLHWAVNQDEPNVDVVAALIAANASACSKPCLKGSLPLHWLVNRDQPFMPVVRALLQVHADGVRTFDKAGWLPIHQCVNRSQISLECMHLLSELYPQGLQCPNANGQLPLHRALDQTAPHLEAVRDMLHSFPGAAKVADDEGYLPLHLALDCAKPDPEISRLLLQVHPEAAFHKSKDGLLPLHCIISAMQPVLEVIEALLAVCPDSVESMAVDVIPQDESADPETWQGEWVEKRWTPLSRAIDRGLDAIVVLFREALHNSHKNNKPVPANKYPPPSNNTAKSLLPQARAPLHNDSTMHSNGNTNMVLGGRLDHSPHLARGEGSYLDDDDNNAEEDAVGPYYNDMLPAPLPAAANMLLPSLKERMVPGGSVVLQRDGNSSSNNPNPNKVHSSSGGNLNSAPPPREREKPPRSTRDRSESREPRERDRTERDRERSDRDRRGDRSERDRNRSSSRHREPREGRHSSRRRQEDEDYNEEDNALEQQDYYDNNPNLDNDHNDANRHSKAGGSRSREREGRGGREKDSGSRRSGSRSRDVGNRDGKDGRDRSESRHRHRDRHRPHPANEDVADINDMAEEAHLKEGRPGYKGFSSGPSKGTNVANRPVQPADQAPYTSAGSVGRPFSRRGLSSADTHDQLERNNSNSCEYNQVGRGGSGGVPLTAVIDMGPDVSNTAGNMNRGPLNLDDIV